MDRILTASLVTDEHDGLRKKANFKAYRYENRLGAATWHRGAMTAEILHFFIYKMGNEKCCTLHCLGFFKKYTFFTYIGNH